MLSHKPDEIWDDDRARWMETADTQGLIPGPSVYRHYVEELQIADGHAVLDLGVGTGRLVPDLLAHTPRVSGMDIAMAMLLHARDLLGDRVPLVKGDAQRLPFRGAQFDRVLAWAVWENIPNQLMALAEVARVLRPGGRILFTSKNLTNRDCLRLVRWRYKGNLVRAFWRRARERPTIARLIPARLRAKFERVMERVDMPQYPTFWPPLVAKARRLGLKPVLVHKFGAAALDESSRASDNAWTHPHFVAVLERGQC